jgi:peptidyl-tRNA hydrolase
MHGLQKNLRSHISILIQSANYWVYLKSHNLFWNDSGADSSAIKKIYLILYNRLLVIYSF